MDYTKKVLITGSNGMLGKDIASLFLSNRNFEVFGLNRKNDSNLDSNHSIICDITNFEELNKVLTKINPDIIIQSAANVNVDGCENDKEYAYNLNAESTKVLASFNCGKTKLVYISTDSVFDGEKGNYNEQEQTNPLNYYALTKFQGEELALANNTNVAVVRTNIYGFHKSEGNSLVEWALKNLKDLSTISGFDDVYFNPVYTKQLAKIVMELVSIDYKGIIHTGCEEFISKYEFLTKLAEKFHISTNLINEISVDSISFNAKRPKNTTLSIDNLKALINFKISIEDGLEQLYADYKQVKGDKQYDKN